MSLAGDDMCEESTCHELESLAVHHAAVIKQPHRRCLFSFIEHPGKWRILVYCTLLFVLVRAIFKSYRVVAIHGVRRRARMLAFRTFASISRAHHHG